MEWIYYNSEVSNFATLGSWVGDSYKLEDDANETLESLNRKLSEEDRTLRAFRRSLAFSQVVQKHLSPLLLECKEDKMVFQSAVRFLVNYLTPIECLCSVDDVAKTEEGQQTLFELHQNLSEAKNVFLDQRITKNILEFMDSCLIKIRSLEASKKKLSSDEEDKGEKDQEIAEEEGESANKPPENKDKTEAPPAAAEKMETEESKSTKDDKGQSEGEEEPQKLPSSNSNSPLSSPSHKAKMVNSPTPSSTTEVRESFERFGMFGSANKGGGIAGGKSGSNQDELRKELLSSPVSKENEEILEECKKINECLTLLRNILHIPDETPSGSSSPTGSNNSENNPGKAGAAAATTATSRQNQILWNLFSGNLDNIVIKIIANTNLSFWCTTLMQMIALIYKDQHRHNLQRLLALWMETELSESSEDNESNTSPQDQNGSCSSPVLTSAENDDSSDGVSSQPGNGHSDKEGSCHADASSNSTDDSCGETGTSKLDIKVQKKASSTAATLGSLSPATTGASSPTIIESLKIKDVEMQSENGSESSSSTCKEPPCKKLARTNIEQPAAAPPKTSVLKQQQPSKVKARKQSPTKGLGSSMKNPSLDKVAKAKEAPNNKRKASLSSSSTSSASDKKNQQRKKVARDTSAPEAVEPLKRNKDGIKGGKEHGSAESKKAKSSTSPAMEDTTSLKSHQSHTTDTSMEEGKAGGSSSTSVSKKESLTGSVSSGIGTGSASVTSDPNKASSSVDKNSSKNTDSSKKTSASAETTQEVKENKNQQTKDKTPGTTGDNSPPCSMSSGEGISSGDYGYHTQQTGGLSSTENRDHAENGCSSTSSNDDSHTVRKRNVKPHTNLQKPRPQKPSISPQEKRELRRKKLIKRAKSDRMKVKALVHHIPTEDDIADLLKEFTVDFLLKGYSTLVDELRRQLLDNVSLQVDKSHYMWLITYFLKFAAQLEVEMELIGPVISIPTIAYLTYEGIRFHEDLELACRQKTVDLKPHLRKVHLVVTAIHEFIQTLEIYSDFSHFSKEDQEHCKKVQTACCQVKELRQLFHLLIRRYKPNVQSLRYLYDVISASHTLITLLAGNSDPQVITDYLMQFASVEVMRQYGLLLENFTSNSDAINDAIFTMMHHVSGPELNCPEALYVPKILRTFSDLWRKDDDETQSICDDWADLIEYVIQKFVTTMGTKPLACASNLLECVDPNSDALDENGFSKNQLDNLYWYYSQCENHTEDPVGGIIEMYKANFSVAKTRLSVIQALLSQGIITHAQYMGLMYMKSVLSCKPYHEGSVIAEAGSEHYCDSEVGQNDTSDVEVSDAENNLGNTKSNAGPRRDQIEVLKDLLKKQGKDYLIDWLQQMLLETCKVKLNPMEIVTVDDIVQEPIPFHFNYVHQSIPLVPWNKQQETGLQTETFILLLHKLGFHLAADVGKCYPRIPHFWSADHIVQLALKLGPITGDMFEIGFDVSTLLANNSDMENRGETSDGGHDFCPATPVMPASVLNKPKNVRNSSSMDEDSCNALPPQPGPSSSFNINPIPGPSSIHPASSTMLVVKPDTNQFMEMDGNNSMGSQEQHSPNAQANNRTPPIQNQSPPSHVDEQGHSPIRSDSSPGGGFNHLSGESVYGNPGGFSTDSDDQGAPMLVGPQQLGNLFPMPTPSHSWLQMAMLSKIPPPQTDNSVKRPSSNYKSIYDDSPGPSSAATKPFESTYNTINPTSATSQVTENPAKLAGVRADARQSSYFESTYNLKPNPSSSSPVAETSMKKPVMSPSSIYLNSPSVSSNERQQQNNTGVFGHLSAIAVSSMGGESVIKSNSMYGGHPSQSYPSSNSSHSMNVTITTRSLTHTAAMSTGWPPPLTLAPEAEPATTPVGSSSDSWSRIEDDSPQPPSVLLNRAVSTDEDSSMSPPLSTAADGSPQPSTPEGEEAPHETEDDGWTISSISRDEEEDELRDNSSMPILERMQISEGYEDSDTNRESPL